MRPATFMEHAAACAQCSVATDPPIGLCEDGEHLFAVDLRVAAAEEQANVAQATAAAFEREADKRQDEIDTLRVRLDGAQEDVERLKNVLARHEVALKHLVTAGARVRGPVRASVLSLLDRASHWVERTTRERGNGKENGHG